MTALVGAEVGGLMLTCVSHIVLPLSASEEPNKARIIKRQVSLPDRGVGSVWGGSDSLPETGAAFSSPTFPAKVIFKTKFLKYERRFTCFDLHFSSYILQTFTATEYFNCSEDPVRTRLYSPG